MMSLLLLSPGAVRCSNLACASGFESTVGGTRTVTAMSSCIDADEAAPGSSFAMTRTRNTVHALGSLVIVLSVACAHEFFIGVEAVTSALNQRDEFATSSDHARSPT